MKENDKLLIKVREAFDSKTTLDTYGHLIRSWDIDKVNEIKF